MFTPSRPVLLPVLTLALLSAGLWCGGSSALGQGDGGKKAEQKKSQTATVSGKVLYQGKPLAGGSVYFTGEKFKTSAKIDRDGTYIVRKLPVGPLKVRIVSKSAAIPKKYTSFKTSGIIVRIKPGDQEINIELQ